MRIIYGVAAFVVGLGLGPQVLASLLSLSDLRGHLVRYQRRIWSRLLVWGLVTAALAWAAGGYQWAFWLGMAVYIPYYGLTYLGLKLVISRAMKDINRARPEDS